MEVNNYFIIQYENYLEIKKKLEECFKTLKNETINENLDKPENENLNQSENKSLNENLNAPENKSLNENLNKKDFETLKSEKLKTNKKDLEKLKIINFIYKKLSLQTHPDKCKDKTSFLKLKKIKEENDFSQIYYFLLTFENIKIKNKILFDSKKKFNLINILIDEINTLILRTKTMKENDLWNAFYHPNLSIREDLKNKILNLIK